MPAVRRHPRSRLVSRCGACNAPTWRRTTVHYGRLLAHRQAAAAPSCAVQQQLRARPADVRQLGVRLHRRISPMALRLWLRLSLGMRTPSSPRRCPLQVLEPEVLQLTLPLVLLPCQLLARQP